MEDSTTTDVHTVHTNTRRTLARLISGSEVKHCRFKGGTVSEGNNVLELNTHLHTCANITPNHIHTNIITRI